MEIWKQKFHHLLSGELGGLCMELAERERNTEQAGRTGTKEATVGASSNRALTQRDPDLS